MFGVSIDSELTMKEHVAKIAAACLYHIRRLRQVRRRVGQEVTQQLVLALVMSRLDYCNSVLAELPTSTLVFGLSRSDHVTPTLIQLHWLPVSYRIRFKLCCLVHAIHYGRSPAYLTETVQSVGASRSRSGLRSSSTSSMHYTLYHGCARNSASGRSHLRVLPLGTLCPLPDHIRTVDDYIKFRKLLKSHYFSEVLIFVDFVCVFLRVLAFA